MLHTLPWYNAGSEPGSSGRDLVVAKWWDRFWGAVWTIGSLFAAFKTAQWFAHNAAPSDLGALRYPLLVFAFLFGLLVAMAILSAVIIGVTIGLERLFAALGLPLRQLQPLFPGKPDQAVQPEPGEPATPEAASVAPALAGPRPGEAD
ncbi:MAG TPA: hypothetical protein VFL91_32430 [Thermomicrobiales bacterium]|nr:hypothetical protein [Thermomicrobiales bacterium]